MHFVMARARPPSLFLWSVILFDVNESALIKLSAETRSKSAVTLRGSEMKSTVTEFVRVKSLLDFLSNQFQSRSATLRGNETESTVTKFSA